jgi:hypothetical protein
MEYFFRCETCGEESIRMNTFQLTFDAEQSNDKPSALHSPEEQFYFLHAHHLLHLMSG